MKKPLFPILTVILLNLFVCFSAMAVGGAVDRINVTSYGAVPNDGADDTAAINSAFNAGRSIYFPAGTYNYNGSMILQGTLANKSFRIYGEGPGVSTIIYTNATSGGINAPSMGQNSLVIEGLTLQAGFNCTTAIDATFGQNILRAATIHNVQIRGSATDGTSGTNWANGIHLVGASHSVLDKVEINGNKNSTTTGIWFEPSSGIAATGFNMSNIQVKWCNTAFRTTGHIEGVYLTGFEFTSCGRAGLPAVDLNVIVLKNGGAFHLVNGTIDMVGGGLYMTKPTFVKVSNVRFVHNGPEATDATMLFINGGFNVTVTQCSFYGVDLNGVGGENGILVSDTPSVQISGNNFNHMLPVNGNCIVAWGNSPALRITDNLFSEYRGQYYVVPTGSPAPYFFGNNP